MILGRIKLTTANNNEVDETNPLSMKDMFSLASKTTAISVDGLTITETYGSPINKTKTTSISVDGLTITESWA